MNIWLPTGKALGKAATLAIPIYAGGTIVFLFAAWYAVIGGLLLAKASNDAYVFMMLSMLAIAYLSAGLLWLIGLTAIYSLVLKVCWTSPPSWLQIPSFTKVMAHFVIGFIATLPLVLFHIAWLMAETSVELATTADLRSIAMSALPDFLFQFAWAWLIVAAYQYHWIGDWFHRSLFQKKNVSSQNTPEASTAETHTQKQTEIEQELAKLRKTVQSVQTLPEQLPPTQLSPAPNNDVKQH